MGLSVISDSQKNLLSKRGMQMPLLYLYFQSGQRVIKHTLRGKFLHGWGEDKGSISDLLIYMKLQYGGYFWILPFQTRLKGCFMMSLNRVNFKLVRFYPSSQWIVYLRHSFELRNLVLLFAKFLKEFRVQKRGETFLLLGCLSYTYDCTKFSFGRL